MWYTQTMKRLLKNMTVALGLLATGACQTEKTMNETMTKAEKGPFLRGLISECRAFEARHPRFAKAFDFLQRPDLADLPEGRYEIDGDNCWAMIQYADLKPFAGETQKAEVHQTYIDIQAPLDGPETYGLYTIPQPPFQPFDAARDVGFAEVKTEPATLQPGEFIVFFTPDGAHAPCLTLGVPERRKKLVIKIRKQ